ncbi:MAG: hypothetical protein COA50_08740 [Flavobacteriaceae bacterium]|nr:MAG: hypothetical protein COA50_08740 [Flavobacteriaceae bacterium]
MKNLRGILLIAALSFFTTSNAQFWKKLTKKAGEAAKEKITQKVEEKTAKETEKTFDTVFNNKGKLFKNKKTKKLASYTFSHQYIMEVISEKDTTDITYYLTNEHEYMASSFSVGEDQEFITVMDLPNSAIHTFMDFGNRKTSNSIKIDLDEVSDSEKNPANFSISPTGQSKKIIGFTCEEFQVTGPQLSGTVWVTQEADISFQKAFSQLKSKKMKGTKGMDQSWVSMVDGLALEMKMIDYSQKKPKPVKMICTSLSKSNFSIDTAAYENPL